MLDFYNIVMFTTLPLRGQKGLQRLLDALLSDTQLIPTHQGLEERRHTPFEAERFVSEVTALQDHVHMPMLIRRKAPTYTLYFQARGQGLGGLRVELTGALKPAQLEMPYQLGDRLAQALEPEYGLVHPFWKMEGVDEDFVYAGGIRFIEYPSHGPQGICARNWLGARILALLEVQRLREAGLEVKSTSWGAVTFDLVDRPWEADYDALHNRYREVMNKLKDTGAFAYYDDSLTKAPRWEPFHPKNA